MPEVKTEMYEANEETTVVLNTMAQHMRIMASSPDGKTLDKTYAMSLAISVASQLFLMMGGNPDGAEQIGEMVKQGIITTLGAYKTMGRINVRPAGQRLN